MGHLWEHGSGSSRDRVRCLARQDPMRTKSATRHRHGVARVPTPCPSSPLPRGAGSVGADHGPQVRAPVPKRSPQPWLRVRDSRSSPALSSGRLRHSCVTVPAWGCEVGGVLLASAFPASTGPAPWSSLAAGLDRQGTEKGGVTGHSTLPTSSHTSKLPALEGRGETPRLKACCQGQTLTA